MKAARVLLLVLMAPLLYPGAVTGQARLPLSPRTEGASGTQSTANAGAEEGEPSLDREVFVYPRGDRRDPFARLLPGNSAETRFEDLRLIGVIHSPDGRESVALISSGAMTPAASTATGERTFRLRQGVVLGNMKVLRVEQARLIVEIRRFGLAEQRELRLNRPPGRTGP